MIHQEIYDESIINQLKLIQVSLQKPGAVAREVPLFLTLIYKPMDLFQVTGGLRSCRDLVAFQGDLDPVKSGLCGPAESWFDFCNVISSEERRGSVQTRPGSHVQRPGKAWTGRTTREGLDRQNHQGRPGLAEPPEKAWTKKTPERIWTKKTPEKIWTKKTPEKSWTRTSKTHHLCSTLVFDFVSVTPEFANKELESLYVSIILCNPVSL
ncbi:uncharacterized protein V6R79_014140 [Siganus canaliculatus]